LPTLVPPRFNGAMPALTRRRYPERQDCCGIEIGVALEKHVYASHMEASDDHQHA
jgi:hypothetical protein